MRTEATLPLRTECIAVGGHEGEPGGAGDVAPTYPFALTCQRQFVRGHSRQCHVSTDESAIVLLESEDRIDATPVDMDTILALRLIRSVVDIIVNMLVEEARLDGQPITLVLYCEDCLVASLALQVAIAQ